MKLTHLTALAGAGRSLFVATTLCAAMAAQAVPITYTFTGAANGSLIPFGGANIAFADRGLTVTISTDTTNITTTRFGAGIPATASLVNGSISINGVGSGSFVQQLYVFNNQSTQTVGFGNLSANDLIDIRNTAAGLNTYDLKSNFSVVGTPPNFVFQFQNIDTTFGSLSLSRLDGATFTASLAAVPEPGTYGLMAAGLAFVGAIARRSRNRYRS